MRKGRRLRVNVHIYLQSPHIEIRSGHSACKLCDFFEVYVVIISFSYLLAFVWIIVKPTLYAVWDSWRHAELVRVGISIYPLSNITHYMNNID